MTPKQLKTGEATKRGIAALRTSFPNRKRVIAGLVKEATQLAAERPYHKGLVSVEHLLEVVGIDAKRIPVLAAHLRTGTAATVDFKKEGISL